MEIKGSIEMATTKLSCYRPVRSLIWVPIGFGLRRFPRGVIELVKYQVYFGKY